MSTEFSSDAGTTLVLVRDLLLASRVTTAAAAAGDAALVIRDPLKLAAAEGVRLLVDLNLDGAIAAAAVWGRRTGRPVIGFVSHVDAETAAAARAAGIDRVLARSRFFERLPTLLRPDADVDDFD